MLLTNRKENNPLQFTGCQRSWDRGGMLYTVQRKAVSEVPVSDAS